MASTLKIAFKALTALSPALPELDSANLCKQHIEGSCIKENCHPKEHKLCRIKDKAQSITPAIEARNNLPRVSEMTKKSFENDGPGNLSKKGPRHDNDHEDIVNVKLLPTIDEIISSRMPYMPKKGDSGIHRFGHGVKRYMDTQFRQLRYESTATIVDASLSGLQRVLSPTLAGDDWRQESSSGTKFSLLKNAQIEHAGFHDKHGAMFQISYDCPFEFQGPRKIFNPPFLDEGMLCALLAVHRETHEVNVVFLQVQMRQSTEAMKVKTGSHRRAAIQAVLADPEDTSKVAELTCYYRGQFKADLHLLDMPNILVVSFLSHLRVLQKLSVTGDFAFKDYITARIPSDGLVKHGSTMPAPSELVENGKFNLNGLKKTKTDTKPLEMEAAPFNSAPRLKLALRDIKERSTLDDGQANALYESLSRELAFTQGPPGTGKTFLGVALLESLLNSRSGAKEHPPIVVVCQTNHALDDFIDELIKRGIKRITRLGGGSQTKWIAPYLLCNQRRDKQTSAKEAAQSCKIKHQFERLYGSGISYAEALNEKGCVPFALVENNLCEKHLDVFKHFKMLDSTYRDKNVQDLRAATMRIGFSFLYWQEGGDIKDANGLIEAFNAMLGETKLTNNWSEAEIAALKNEVSQGFRAGVELAGSEGSGKDLWAMDQSSRQQLAHNWLEEANPQAVCEAFAELHRRFLACQARRRRQFDDTDSTTITRRKTQIVGMTSTACATMRGLLEKLAPQVIMFEEASELIEAHSTIALVATVKHCIQIGDPLQLRPHVEQRELSMENNPSYRLDESLFERFMSSGVPYSRLNTQRRAHPEIADLLRVGDYPYLIDHPNTSKRPPVNGMASRMWWFNHTQPEDRINRLSALSKSSSNQYEVKFIAAFVRYLVGKQNYKFREITVLTPYKGQLAALQTELSQICKISLTEKDRNDMIDAELIEDKEHADGTTLEVKMSDMLRIATVDNYQGEQARVIIFSAVRSNAKNSAGFLANHNRTNVAISRAEDGFFVIGNAALIERDDHWAKVIKSFRDKGAIGSALVAQCHRHPGKSTSISSAVGFDAACCNKLCNEQLACGHVCTAPCHPPEMHYDGRMPCSKSCIKVRTCGHGCNKNCGERCGPCTTIGEPVQLSCGHSKQLNCSEQTCAVKCTEPVKTIDLPCGHTKAVLCSDSAGKDLKTCTKPCDYKISCGHRCSLKCGDCKANGKHTGTCTVTCDRKLECGHTCKGMCHEGACPPCKETCKKNCAHGECQQACHEPCKPCIQLCERERCEHSNEEADPTICCLPSNTLPCSKACTKLLACGLHTCNSICGEACPEVCEECSTGQWATKSIMLPCKHTFPIEQLDESFGLRQVYETDSLGEIKSVSVTSMPKAEDLVCPTCGTLSRGSRRYELLNALAGVSGTVNQLMITCAKMTSQSHRDVSMGEQLLFIRLGEFLSRLKTGPMSTSGNQVAINERCDRLIDAQQRAMQNKATVVKIEDAIQQACKHVDNAQVFPTPELAFGLRHDLLYFWSRLAMVEYAHRIAGKFGTIPHPDLQNRLFIKTYTVHAIENAAGECAAINEKIAACVSKNLKRLEVEFRIIQLCFWAILQAHRTTEKVALDVNASLERVNKLTICFPKSAGLFAHGFNQLKTCIARRHLAPRFWELNTVRSNALWVNLKKLEGGPLTPCAYRHLYSTSIFSDGCPECGQELRPVQRESLDRKSPDMHMAPPLMKTVDADLICAKVQAFAIRT